MATRKKKKAPGDWYTEEIRQQLAIYNQPSSQKKPKREQSGGLTRVGKISSILIQSQANFTCVEQREVEHEEEEPDPRVKPQVSKPLNGIPVCAKCHCTLDDEYTYGYLPGMIPCPTCTPRARAARQRRKVESLIRKLVYEEKMFDMQNLPEDAHHCSLSAYPGNQGYVALIQQFVTYKVKELYFHGLTGVGKTGLGYSAIHEIYLTGGVALFLPMERYLELLRENFQEGATNNQIKTIVHTVPTLILDEVGIVEKHIEFTLKEMQLLLEARHAAGLRTLITSNYSPDALATLWGTADQKVFQPRDRVLSRLRGWYKTVEIKGRDLRRGENS